MRQFGSLSAIADAPDEDLRQCALYGERWIESFLAARSLVFDGMRERAIRTRLGKNDRSLHRYLFSTLRRLKTERLVGIFADEAGHIIREEVLAEGSEASTSISPRMIFRRALMLDCRRILIAHNHPSGSAEPSRSDIDNTSRLVRQAGELGIKIDDHLIVGRHSISSMRARGLL